MPYAIGTYRADWERYPVLIRQYHPEFNEGVTLTQIPPLAEVLLVWQCDVGHVFVATPEEQRDRPGQNQARGERRKSSWCPDCAALAVRRRAPLPAAPDVLRPELLPPPYACGHPRDLRRIESGDDDRCYLCRRLDSGGPDGSAVTRERLLSIVTPGQRDALAIETGTAGKYRWVCGRGHGTWESTVERMLGGRGCRICANASLGADRVAVGEAFVSALAPKPASAVEGDLRSRIADRFDFDLGNNAIRVAKPFFNQLEIWPDIIVPELRVAIEYDSVGRHGLEHVGRHEEKDRRKDRMLRAVGWQVIRVRAGRLQPLGPHDLVAGSVSGRLIERLDDELAAIGGDLMVASYRR